MFILLVNFENTWLSQRSRQGESVVDSSKLHETSADLAQDVGTIPKEDLIACYDGSIGLASLDKRGFL